MIGISKIGKGWKFELKASLEAFVWTNLTQIVGYTPLSQQYYVNGQIGDILALDNCRQLIVIELKNTEDRYIV